MILLTDDQQRQQLRELEIYRGGRFSPRVYVDRELDPLPARHYVIAEIVITAVAWAAACGAVYVLAQP